MEKRRRAFRLAAAVALSAASSAWACTPAIDGTQLESERYVVAYKSEPIEVAKHFALDIAACAKAGNPPPEALKVDAQMPEHRRGMNYAPKVKTLEPGHWRAEGLMLHMPGRWELVFELRAAGQTDRVSRSIELASLLDFSRAEIAAILRHGPWPPPAKCDPSNRVSGKPEAIAFGERLFFEPRLSGTGSVLCASCHVPYRAFQDARARAFGLEEVARNTPTLVNVAFYRRYGWDGARESLPSQSIRPLLEPREMRSSAAHIATFVRQSFAQ